MQLDDLYRRVIMDHYKTPRNYGQLEGTLSIDMNNPSCGDSISLHMIMEDGIVQKAKFEGQGCSISLASASMMTEAVKGRTFAEAQELAKRFSLLMRGEDVSFDEFEDIEALSGVNKFPARIKCATLGWNAMKKGLMQHHQKDTP